MEPAAALKVKVVTPDGRPAPGVQVQALRRRRLPGVQDRRGRRDHPEGSRRDRLPRLREGLRRTRR
ncbi:hypothetical protein G5V59_02040 [Nocardioides sp. W3-2-3]|uniref:hypothetical protein n=1 Tax=Nocardioides convexus TaxID=2712224 RepID=UPI002418764E|nr:hypothetical protein [Nocardioides convexus]NGZ99573.1 hypothetical protein [Nocardioides convexus]